MSDGFLDEVEDYFDSIDKESGNGVESVNIVKPNNSANLDIFYKKLEDLGFNLDELKQILECPDTMLILSGAGSGKTTALILKIIRDLIAGDTMKVVEVDNGMGATQVVMPGNILVSTFLKSGAEELKTSFREWCKKLKLTGLDAGNIKFKTIHAEVFDALKQMGVKVDVLDNSDSILKSLMRKYGIRSALSTSRAVTIDEVKDVSGIMMYARNRLDNKRYEHSLMSDYKLDTMLLNVMLAEYKALRNATGKMDFEDMQEMLLEALRMNPNVVKYIQSRYDYIYVDEFQDTSQLQYEILKCYFNGAKKVLAIGDDDQCLVEGTLVNTDTGIRLIEDVRVGDLVLSGVGRSKVDYHYVDNVSKKLINEEIMVIKTKTGKEIRGTKEHIGFARLVPDADVHYVYLMYRDSVGFRIGQTKGVRAGARGTLKNGISIRLTQEKADKVWLIRKADSLEEATFWESYYSYKYGIPQYIFKDSTGKTGKLALSFERIKELHEKLGTKENGFRLLNDLGLAVNYPHCVPQAGSERCKLNYSMLTSIQTLKNGVHKSELSANTSNEVFTDILKNHLPTIARKVTNSENVYYNARSTTGFIDSQLDLMKDITQECKDKGINIEVNRNAKFTDEKYDFMPLGNFVEGMYVPILDGDTIIEDEVISVTKEIYNGYVYDISVPNTRNFTANGVVVHNCIYTWRGSDEGIINHKFEEDYKPTVKQLTVNYRCKSGILNAVIPSIELNTGRHEKKLRAYSEGGEVNIVVDGDVNHLIDSLKGDLTKNQRVGVLARTNADLLMPSILLELDGTVDFGLAKSVSLNNRLSRQVFGIMDLITKRFTEDFEGYFRLFLSRNHHFEAKKLDNILRTNKGMNIYNIPIQDLKYSLPNLSSFINGLRKAKETDDVLAYMYILTKLEKEVYRGKSVYAQSARAFIGFVRRIIMEHKDVKDLDIGQLDSLFNIVLPERIMRRTKYGKDTFVKLTTVHDAKGKEWESVYIWNDIKGSFPNIVGGRALTDEEYEEERRVHYIAWTRAKDKLTVYTSETKQGDFLKECDLNSVQANIVADEENKKDLHLVFKKKEVATEANLPDGKDVSTMLREYTSEVYLGGKVTDVRVANVDIVLESYDFESLVDILKNEYGLGLISEGEELATKEIFDGFFKSLADELFNI